jgi:uncharacterized protein
MTAALVRDKAIITGASAGIGAALARALARAGFDLVLVARRADRLEALAQELRPLGSKVEVLPLDVTDPACAQRLKEAVPDATVLINNAGFGVFGPALEANLEEQCREVRVNCEALTRLTLAVAPSLVARGRGVIVNLASIASFQAVPYFTVYAASKAYVLSFSEALDVELAPRGVRVVAVCPGPVPTEFQQIAGSPEAHHSGRLAMRTPDEIADSVVDAIRRPRPVVVPAPIHRAMWFVQRLAPRGLITRLAGKGMLKRIEGLKGGG